MYYGQYFDWLCDIINLRPGTYDILIQTLYAIPFTWVLDLDSNRAEDGLILRGDFHDECGYIEKLDDKPCSVLEALIGIARKMDYILDDDDKGDRTRIWFWEMISNLSLNTYSDSYLDHDGSSHWDKINDIFKICDQWMDRRFDYTGRGSPFPLYTPYRDQRGLQIIDQLNDYILENYIIDDEIM